MQACKSEKPLMDLFSRDETVSVFVTLPQRDCLGMKIKLLCNLLPPCVMVNIFPYGYFSRMTSQIWLYHFA